MNQTIFRLILISLVVVFIGVFTFTWLIMNKDLNICKGGDWTTYTSQWSRLKFNYPAIWQSRAGEASEVLGIAGNQRLAWVQLGYHNQDNFITTEVYRGALDIPSHLDNTQVSGLEALILEDADHFKVYVQKPDERGQKYYLFDFNIKAGHAKYPCFRQVAGKILASVELL